MGAKDNHSQVFLEEADELPSELETAPLELEEAPDDKDLIGRIFRAMRTIKGSGAMFGFVKISKFTHEIETVFDLVRNGKMAASKDLINVTLPARDQIILMLNAPEGVDPDLELKNASLIASLKNLIPAALRHQTPLSAAPVSRDALPSARETIATYRIAFRPFQGIFKTGASPVLLLQKLCGLGACTVVAQTDAIPFLEDFDAAACYSSWDITLTTDRGQNAVRDVFRFIQENAELKIEVVDVIDTAENIVTQPYNKKLGDILLERGDVTADIVKHGLSAQKRIGQILVEMGAIGANKVASALAEQEHVRDVREKQQKEESAQSVRVPAEKLDRLVDLVGELVTVQARLSQAATAASATGEWALSWITSSAATRRSSRTTARFTTMWTASPERPSSETVRLR